MPFAEILAAFESMRAMNAALLEICEDMVDSSDARLIEARESLETADAAIEKIKQHGPE